MFTKANDVITCATSDDFDELLDMMDEVFSERKPHDFRNYLPALYKPDDKHCNCNLTIRRDNKIVASLGVFPINFQTNYETSLRMAAIGGVCVDKRFRGQGLMKKLMVAAKQQMEEDNYDLCYLGGQRQRYRYHGYERCGSRYRLHITKNNIRHGFSDCNTENITLKKVENNPKLLKQVQNLHRTQPTWCRRDFSEFSDYLRQWNNSCWAALDEDSNPKAYLISNLDNKIISELIAADTNSALELIKLWIETNNDIDILLPTIPTPLVRKLIYNCEYSNIESTGNWQIFNWPKTLTTLLKLRRCFGQISEGGLTLELSDLGINLKLWSNQAGAGCEKTNNKPDISVTSKEAMSLLFGPTRPNSVVEIPPAANILENWSPLPLHLPITDHT